MGILENESNGYARRRNWTVAIAGLMGAGKTTLAQQLARAYGWEYVPAKRVAKSYIEDLFAAPSRWAFEAQVAMFCAKAVEVTEHLRNRRNVIIDRSLEEDASVFVAYFHDGGHIDERAFSTYRSIADDFRQRVGLPDVTIYCKVSAETALKRITERGRGEEKFYPPGHVAQLAQRYAEWVATYDLAPIYSLDSERIDWRKPDTAQEIAEELVEILSSLTRPIEQISLFGSTLNDASPRRLTLLVPEYNPIRSAHSLHLTRPGMNRAGSVKKRAYVAAPFTGAEAAKSYANDPQGGFDTMPVTRHGRIEPGEYRDTLNRISQVIGSYGFDVILPHRDVNKWGEAALSPEQVMRSCTDHVIECDLFVGMLGQSCGSHYEFGLAVALNKTCIVIAPTEVPHSFVAQGVQSLVQRVGRAPQYLLVLSVTHLSDAPTALSQPVITRFLQRAFEGRLPHPAVL